MTTAPETAAVVLVVEDDLALRELLRRALPKLGFQVIAVADVGAALRTLDAEPVDVVLTDLHLGSGSGIDLCADAREHHPEVPALVMTAFGNLDVAIQAIRAGAWDFLTKPLDLELAKIALERALEHRRLGQEVRRLRRRVRASQAVEGLIGESEPMRALFAMMARVAEVDSNVLIVGESGTGKELVAHALHRLGRRRDKPFVAVNCAAIPENLLESELFGHVRGAFTDARSSRTGLFVQAQGGTLLLDEIGDMPLPLQVKLLRVLQERKVRPVGSESEIGIDVRLMAATHQALGSTGQVGSVPSGPPLPPRCHPARGATPPRPRPRRPAPRPEFRERGGDTIGQAGARAGPRSGPQTARPRLAGERPRAAELHRARGGALGGRGTQSSRICRPNCAIVRLEIAKSQTIPDLCCPSPRSRSDTSSGW